MVLGSVKDVAKYLCFCLSSYCLDENNNKGTYHQLTFPYITKPPENLAKFNSFCFCVSRGWKCIDAPRHIFISRLGATNGYPFAYWPEQMDYTFK